MNSPHHPHHHHDVHQQRLLWFFSFCNQRSSSSSNSSSSSTHSHGGSTRRSLGSRRTKTSNRNKFALQYQQQLQKQQRQSSNVFGMELIEHTHMFGDHQDSVPFIVKACSKFIEKHGIIFGIYRLSGMRVNIHKLRQDFDKNPKISTLDSESINNDAHAVACVLKQYFRELPTPLLTFHMYEKFIELFKQSSNNSVQEDDDNDDEEDDDDQTITTTSLTPTKTNEVEQEEEHCKVSSASSTLDRKKIVHNSKEKLGSINRLRADEPFQNIDDDGDEVIDDDVDINCGDTARTILDKKATPTSTTSMSITQPITKQPPAVTTSTPHVTLPSNASKIINTTTTNTNLPLKEKTTFREAAIRQQQPKPAVANIIKKMPLHQQSTTAIETRTQAKHCNLAQKNQKSTKSASDSQLISLSSVVTTATTDVKYQVKLDDLRQLLFQLPRANYQTLKYLMRHLAFIAANGKKTGMDSKNVAIVWAPNLLKPRELELSAGHIETLQVIGLQAVITEQLIKHHQFLFNNDLDESVIAEEALPTE